MAARLTPDQKVGRSNRSGLIFIYSHGYRTVAWACETAAGSAGTGCLVELLLGAPGLWAMMPKTLARIQGGGNNKKL